MITYDNFTSGSLQSIVFSIPYNTIGSTTSYNLSISNGLNGYIIPFSFLIFNKTDATIDKVLFKDTFANNNFTHEQNIDTSAMYDVQAFSQGPPAPKYSPTTYQNPQILVQWSNLGHTYTTGSLNIKIVYYISKKFWI